MSENPTPPPMPVRVLPVTGPELYTGRPGAIAFLGIAGMLVAIFGAMFSAYFLLVLNVLGARTTAVVTPSQGGGIIWSVTGGSQLQDDDSMPRQQRTIVIAGMNAQQALTPGRKALVNALLGDVDGDVLGIPRSGLTKAYVQSLISEAGRTEDGSADYFVFGSGRLQVSDTAASFRPNDSSETYQVDQKAVDLPGAAMSASEIDRVMASLKDSGLNPAQRAALPKYLADPSQQLFEKRISPDDAVAGYAYSQTEEVTYITSSTGGWIQMDSNGNVIGTAGKPSMVWARGAGGVNIPRHVTLLLTIENLLSILLSIGLFLICLGALRYAPKTRRRYLMYALAKPATLILGGIGVYQLISSAGWSGPVALTAVYLAAGLAFPSLTLILMQTTGVRNYFTSQGQ